MIDTAAERQYIEWQTLEHRPDPRTEVYRRYLDLLDAIDLLQAEPDEIVHAIRRTDGELMHGEYSWSTSTGPDDWEPAELDSEDAGYPDTIEFEMIEMRCRTIATKSLPENPHVERDGECEYCGEGWPCEWVRDTNQPTKEAERG